MSMESGYTLQLFGTQAPIDEFFCRLSSQADQKIMDGSVASGMARANISNVISSRWSRSALFSLVNMSISCFVMVKY